MKCEICHREIHINWGNSQHVLCEMHSNSKDTQSNPEISASDLPIAESESHSLGVKVWNTLFLIIYILALFPWLGISAISIMAFDSPGSENRIGPWLLVGFVWSYPIWAGTFCIASAMSYRHGKYEKSMLLSIMPIIFGISVIVCFYIYGTILN